MRDTNEPLEVELRARPGNRVAPLFACTGYGQSIVVPDGPDSLFFYVTKPYPPGHTLLGVPLRYAFTTLRGMQVQVVHIDSQLAIRALGAEVAKELISAEADFEQLVRHLPAEMAAEMAAANHRLVPLLSAEAALALAALHPELADAWHAL